MRNALAKLIGMNCAFFLVLVIFAANHKPWQWHAAQVGYDDWTVDTHMMESSIAFRVREHLFWQKPKAGFAWVPERAQTQFTPNGPMFTAEDRGFAVHNGTQFGSPWSGVATWREWSVSAPYWFIVAVLAAPACWWAWHLIGRMRWLQPKPVFQTPA